MSLAFIPPAVAFDLDNDLISETLLADDAERPAIPHPMWYSQWKLPSCMIIIAI